MPPSDESRKTYGRPRVLEDLCEAGERVGGNRVIPLRGTSRPPVRRRRPQLTSTGNKFFLAAIVDLYSRCCVGWSVQDLLRDHGIECSMSRRGNCHDDAAMESGFSTVKAELGEVFESIAHGKPQLFDYIELFDNQRRRHSTLDYVSPARYE